MEVLVQWFSHHLAQFISPEGAVFIISMIPILELRGGLLAASLLKISAAKALPLCIVGNIIPIPFILLFIRQIFKWMKKTKTFRGLITKLENRAMRQRVTRSRDMNFLDFCCLWESLFRAQEPGQVH